MVEYFQDERISQSKLKLLLVDPVLFITVEEPDSFGEDKRHFILGNAVDCKITTPHLYDDLYYESTLENKPSEGIKNIIYEVYQAIEDKSNITLIQDYRELILEQYELQAFQARQLPETKFSKACEAFEYFEELKNSNGKQLLSVEESALINQIVISIKTNPDIAHYFQEEKGTEILYQVFIKFDYLDVPCKALLDMVIINHNDKTIQPIDIKTLSDYTLNFLKSLRRRRYDIQAASYTKALETFKYEKDLVDYTILPFKFIVESTVRPGTPLVFTMSQSLLNTGLVGTSEKTVCDEFNNPLIKIPEVLGFFDLINLYKYYLEHGFEKPKLIVEQKSELSIDWLGIY